MYLMLLNRFGLNDFLIIIEMSWNVGMRLRRIPTYFFDNRLVIVHQSLSKNTDTRNTEAFL